MILLIHAVNVTIYVVPAIVVLLLIVVIIIIVIGLMILLSRRKKGTNSAYPNPIIYDNQGIVDTFNHIEPIKTDIGYLVLIPISYIL